jgi:DNA-binding beta-propeller fold protein YncE
MGTGVKRLSFIAGGGSPGLERKDRGFRSRLSKTLLSNFLLGFYLLNCLTGCSKSPLPDAVWLDTGTGPGQVVYPRGIAYSPRDGTIFVVDRMARVQHLDRNGNYLNDWSMPARQQGKPVGLSVGPDGNVYVPDTHYYRVIVYTPEGKEIRRFGSFGRKPGQFIYPTDIAWDTHGNMFVSEYGDDDRIQVFDQKTGQYKFTFGSFGQGDGQFIRPQDMVIFDDLLYVTDACNHRIDVFKTDGTWLRNMGSCGSAPGQFRFPYGMDIDREGHLIVSEFGNNRIQMIDRQTGKGLKIWGQPGRDPGELAYPWGVIVDQRDRIISVDAGNNRLQVFEF